MSNRIIPYRTDLKNLARTLRKNMTLAEVLLWEKVRGKNLGYQFHRQVPMDNFIVDFFCHELMLAIEIDGSSHDHPEVSISDRKRQEKLESYGIHFLRFDDHEIKSDIDSVLQTIENWIALHESS